MHIILNILWQIKLIDLKIIHIWEAPAHMILFAVYMNP